MAHSRPASKPPDGDILGVAQRRVRTALAALPRSMFETGGRHRGERHDGSWPMDDARLPKDVAASMLGALALDGTERVLDAGSTSAYTAALLSRLAREVVSIEATVEGAETRVRQLSALGGCHNVEVVVGLPEAGHARQAPYQAILVAAGASQLPEALLDQLDRDGRLVIALGNAEGQLLERVRKRSEGIIIDTICPCHLPMLSERQRRPSSFPWADDKP
jgi:protein-L-isoaspartate(D-aspartate) O-methyltransferase